MNNQQYYDFTQQSYSMFIVTFFHNTRILTYFELCLNCILYIQEDELNAELAEMENELIDKDLMDTPVVPVHDIKSQPIIKPTTIEDNINIAPVKSTSPKQPVVIGANGNSNSHAPAKKANVTDKEAEELKQLEALMGS